MNELRKDVFTNKEVIMAICRNERPSDLKGNIEEETVKEYEENCAFCIGNENLTMDTILESRDEGGWSNRLFANKYPIFSEMVESEKSKSSHINDKDIYKSFKTYGYHDVLVECSRHNGTFFNMSLDEFYNYFCILKRRLEIIKGDIHIKYVGILKNYKKEAAASLRHPHSQIVAMNFIPKDVEEKLNIAKNYYMVNNESLYDTVIDDEIKKGERVIHNGRNFLVLAPFASINPGGVRIMYKGNKGFDDIDEKEIKELSTIFTKLFKNLLEYFGDIPFNISFTLCPTREVVVKFFKWYIDFIPRNGFLGGFEFSTGVAVNGLLPEKLAKSIRFK